MSIPTPPTGLRELARNSFKSALEEIKSKFRGTRFVLIVDKETLPITSNLFTMTEFVEMGIILVERLDLARHPLQAYHAIYLLSPSSDINLFINDFAAEPLYAAPHLLFTYRCPNSIEQALIAAPKVLNLVQSFIELYIDFRALEPFLFTVACRNPFAPFFAPCTPDVSLKSEIEIETGLVSVFVTMRSFPDIAYPKQPQNLASIAQGFTDHLQVVANSLPNDRGLQRDNSLLLILPRTYDLVAPLLHQFSYGALIHETLKVENNTVDIDGKTVFLNPYDDDVYETVEYMHFTEAREDLDRRRQAITDRQNQLRTIPDRLDNGKPNPAHRDLLKKISSLKSLNDRELLHFQVITQLHDAFSSRGLVELAEWEQSLVTGVSAAGDRFAPSQADLSLVLSQRGLNELDKVRLLALYQAVSKKKLNDQALQMQIRNNGVNDTWIKALQNIAHLANLDSRSDKMRRGSSILTDKYYSNATQIVERVTNEALSDKEFVAPKQRKRYQNIVVFFVGGVSYMELYQLNQLRSSLRGTKLYIGSTSTINPEQFLTQVKNLS